MKESIEQSTLYRRKRKTPQPRGGEPPRADDCRSLSDVYARRGLLVRLAYRFCWNIDDAEDAVQTALATATQKQEQLSEERKLWSWVKSIVVRECLNIKRRASLHRRTTEAIHDQRQTIPANASPADALIRTEFTELVRELIATLPQGQRAAIVLRHIEEMSYKSIAEVLTISESTARVQVRNARQALRRAILKRQPQWAMDDDHHGL